jgi:hypothetical protein
MKRLLILLTMLLTGCSEYTPADNYCEQEHRQIPDVELKARMLTNVRNPGYPHFLTAEMEQYLTKRNLPFDAPKADVQKNLTEFIESHPLCCQFAVKEIWTKHNYPFVGDETPESGYFANLYILNPPYGRIPDEGFPDEADEFWVPRTAHEYFSANIHHVLRAHNCGRAWIIQLG